MTSLKADRVTAFATTGSSRSPRVSLASREFGIHEEEKVLGNPKGDLGSLFGWMATQR
jgi:hypothetical protein